MKLKAHDDMVTNILNVWYQATGEQREQGRVWYAKAQNEAHMLRTDIVTTPQVAGVIAAVSPRMSWAKNVALASKLIDQYEQGEPLSGYLVNGLAKSLAILNGRDPFEVLTGQKQRAFYECIIHAGQTDIVCVDRHAMSVAYGCTIGESEQSMTPRQYLGYVDAYQSVARAVGVPAAVLQATTWIVWRGSAA